jgi:hypothetical protein
MVSKWWMKFFLQLLVKKTCRKYSLVQQQIHQVCTHYLSILPCINRMITVKYLHLYKQVFVQVRNIRNVWHRLEGLLDHSLSRYELPRSFLGHLLVISFFLEEDFSTLRLHLWCNIAVRHPFLRERKNLLLIVSQLFCSEIPPRN